MQNYLIWFSVDRHQYQSSHQPTSFYYSPSPTFPSVYLELCKTISVQIDVIKLHNVDMIFSLAIHSDKCFLYIKDVIRILDIAKLIKPTFLIMKLYKPSNNNLVKLPKY